MEEGEKAWEKEKWLASGLMQKVSWSVNACSKICRANPSAINRCQCSTALDTEQDQQRDRRLPISPVLLPFPRRLTVKPPHRAFDQESTLFTILFHRKRTSRHLVFPELKFSASKECARQQTGQLHPRLTYSAWSRFVGPPDSRLTLNCSKGHFYDCISVSYPVEARSVIETKKEMWGGQAFIHLRIFMLFITS